MRKDGTSSASTTYNRIFSVLSIGYYEYRINTSVDSSGYILERKGIFTERSLNVQIFSNIHTISLIIQIKEFITKLLHGKTNIIKGVTIENFTKNLY